MPAEQPQGAIRSLPTGTVSAQVFSADGKTLYTVRNNAVSAHDIASGATTATWTVGNRLGGVDISPDGRYLVVSEIGWTPGAAMAPIYRIDLTTGTAATFQVPRQSTFSYSTGFGDIVYLADGRVMLSGTDQWEAFTTFDFASGTSSFAGYYYPGAFTRSADYGTILATSVGISGAPVSLFSGTGALKVSKATLGGSSVQAISPDGRYIVQGVGLAVYDSNLTLLAKLSDRYPFNVSGFSFSADNTKLYLLDPAAKHVFMLAVGSWDVLGGFPIGAELAQEGPVPASRTSDSIHASADGAYLTVTAGTSVQVIDLNKVVSDQATSAGNDMVVGDSDRNTLYGFEGDDTLDGRSGADRMYGGAGNDTYHVDDRSDAAIEFQGGGTDTIITSLDGYTLDTNVERLVLSGNAKTGYGNNEAKVLVANDLGNTLYGMAGDDVLIGGRGADELRGGTGNDRMVGGAGNDLYYVDSPADVIVEAAGEGIDTVIASITLTLSDHVENLTLEAGTRTFGGSGNALANVITGNSGDNALYGLGGNDSLVGGLGEDRLFGGDGDDVLLGGAGNDLLDGGAGYETLSYAVLSRGGAVTRGAGTEVRIAAGGDVGTDTLRGIDDIVLKDGLLSFDENDAWAQVVRIYDTALQRLPDGAGLDFHTARITSGQTNLLGVATDFLNSGEFQAATGGLNNQQFVRYIYQTALDREPDAGGLAYWTGQLDGGVSRASMLVLFSETAEHRALTASALDQGYFTTDVNYQNAALLYDTGLGRLPDAGGIVFWGDALKGGQQSIGSMAAAMAGSAEFQTRTAGFSNAQLVDYMYQNTLDRQGDAGGRAYWTAQLDAGLSKADLIQNFALSAEHRALLAPFIDHGIAVI